MAKQISPPPAVVERSYFPCYFTRIVLGFLGAIPFSLQYPHLPSRALTKSNFLYCISCFGLTLWSTYQISSYALGLMQTAKPYNHFRYIVSFEVLAIQTLNITIIMSWIDTTALTATIHAWYQLIDKYEEVLKEPLPNHKTLECLSQTVIIVSVPVVAFCSAKLVETEFKDLCQLKFLPGLTIPAMITTSLVHHWTGYYLAVECVSKKISKHFKQASNENVLTSKLVEEYKSLWRLLRNILDQINNQRIPLYIFALQSILAAVTIYESILLYWKSGNAPVATFNFAISGYYLIPMIHYCRAGQRVTETMELIFEDAVSYLKLSSVSDKIQNQILFMYLMKRTRKPEVRLFGYHELGLRLLLSTLSAITVYILIMIQFHHMKV